MPELPTPANADSPKQKKHREQAIVVGTLLLVILTFVLVVRRGQNSQAGVTSDPNSYQPDTAGGGSFGDPNAALQSEIGALPGQIAALDSGKIQGVQKRNMQQTARLNAQAKRIRQQAAKIKRLGKQEHKLASRVQQMSQHPLAHAHPRAPQHRIPVTAHAPHPREHWTAVHPPTHSGRKVQPIHGAIFQRPITPAR